MNEFFSHLLESNPGAVATGVCTLLGAILGAIISLISTNVVEDKRFKHQRMENRLKDVLIPYCKSIEDTIIYLKSFYENRYENLSAVDSFKCDKKKVVKDITKPLLYLSAEKRTYLSKKDRKQLEKLRELMDDLEEQWFSDFRNAKKLIGDWFGDNLKEYPSIPFEPTDYFVNYYPQYIEALSWAIVTKDAGATDKDFLRMSEGISSLSFMKEEGSRSFDISIPEGLRSCGYLIVEYGVGSIDQFDAEDQLGIDFLKFINENIPVQKEHDFIEETLGSSKTGETMSLILAQLKAIQRMLNKEIDRIAA